MKRSIFRIARMVSYPSMTGIMMSIRTMSMSGIRSSVAMASAPLSATMTSAWPRSRSAVMAKMLRKSSSTTRIFRPVDGAVLESVEPASIVGPDDLLGVRPVRAG